MWPSVRLRSWIWWVGGGGGEEEAGEARGAEGMTALEQPRHVVGLARAEGNQTDGACAHVVVVVVLFLSSGGGKLRVVHPLLFLLVVLLVNC